MKTKFLFVLICISSFSFSQKLYFPANKLKDSVQVHSSITSLAKKLIDVYKEEDRLTYLTNLLYFQTAAENYSKSLLLIDSIRVKWLGELGQRILQS